MSEVAQHLNDRIRDLVGIILDTTVYHYVYVYDVVCVGGAGNNCEAAKTFHWQGISCGTRKSKCQLLYVRV